MSVSLPILWNLDKLAFQGNVPLCELVLKQLGPPFWIQLCLYYLLRLHLVVRSHNLVESAQFAHLKSSHLFHWCEFKWEQFRPCKLVMSSGPPGPTSLLNSSTYPTLSAFMGMLIISPLTLSVYLQFSWVSIDLRIAETQALKFRPHIVQLLV